MLIDNFLFAKKSFCKRLKQTSRNLITVFLSSFHAFNKDELSLPPTPAITESIVESDTLIILKCSQATVKIETNKYNLSTNMWKERKVHAQGHTKEQTNNLA